MLFRRFILVTASIALIGIAVVNLVQSTTFQEPEFAVGDRLKLWKMHQQRPECAKNPRICLEEVLANRRA